MTPRRRESLLALGLGLVTVGAFVRAQDEFDFAIAPKFLEQIEAGHTILPSFRIHIDARSDIKDVGQDCEVHLAGTMIGQDQQFGDPDHVVVEPPNECRFKPGASTPTTPAAKAAWRTLLDSKVVGKDCTIVGYPRIFTEHAEGGSGAGSSNPNHVFELHPALRIACDGQTPIEFFKALAAPAGLRHIKATSAASCLAGRTLSVRFKDGQYEFKQKGGQGCGNFAIVEVGALNAAWIRDTGGGHSAIARVSADGTTRESLKIYTLAGTKADDWLAGLMPPPGTAPKINKDHILIHGVLTYDYFAMIRELHDQGAPTWKHPATWTDIPFPLAFIVYGQTQTVPWDEAN
jgi:hypothetical protein